jgi:transposase
MRKIKEVLRLHAAGLTHRQIARCCALGRTTVREYLVRAQTAQLTWPLPGELDEAALERQLFPPPPTLTSAARGLPDWAQVHQELKRKGVTLCLLWEEYRSLHPEGYRYSWFCKHYSAWAAKIDVVMRQPHRAGEKLFVDYAGQMVPVVDRATGEVRHAQIFVAVLGASSYTYAEATWTQSLPDWIGSHQRCFAHMGGVTELLVPDNLKCAVIRAHRYQPDLNRTYAEMAAHYAMAIVPARVAKPRDKSKVEVGVQVVERWILARLRHQIFFGLDELNCAITELLERLNARPFKKLPGSRRSLFECLERPVLRALPGQPYEYAEWHRVRVGIDYHVGVERHYYSVPYQLVKCEVEARVSARMVEILHRGQRVASHRRSPRKVGYTTCNEHMPSAHRAYAEWTPQRLVRWAHKTGGATAEVIAQILGSRPHPQQGFRSCLGVLRLGKRYGEARLEAACQRALRIRAVHYKSIESILKNGLDQQPLPAALPQPVLIAHDNIRGPDYYH